MTWRLACPLCGHFGSVSSVRGGRGKVFSCSCGLTFTALSSSDLKDKLNRLAKKVHTARVLAHPPPSTPPPRSVRCILLSSPARFVLWHIAKGLSLLRCARARFFPFPCNYGKEGEGVLKGGGFSW